MISRSMRNVVYQIIFIFHAFFNRIYHLYFLAIVLTTICITIHPVFSQELNDPVVQKKFGSIEKIKAETEFNIVFKNDDIRIAQFDSENSFVKFKMNECESRKPGSGAEWSMEWQIAQDSIFKEEFINSLNKILNRKIRLVARQMHARYTLVVRTKYIEPGKLQFQLITPAICHFEFDFVEFVNPGEVILSLDLQNVWNKNAKGYDITIGKIARCYVKAGKILGKYLIQYME